MRMSRWALAALVPIVALTLVMVAAPQSAEADGPTTLGRSPWQFMRGPIVAPVPDYGSHGAKEEYDHRPASEIPGDQAPGWLLCKAGEICPDPDIIGMNMPYGSRLGGYDCRLALDFTFFQSFVSIPLNATIDEFKVEMNNADDGARVSIFNTAHPNGFVFDGSYIFLGPDQSTTDLRAAMVKGAVNRVVITQVDDCWSGNNLHEARITLNGNTVVVTPNADLSITKTAPATAVVGTDFMYAINLQNAGPTGAPAIVIQDTLPANVKFIGASPACTHSGPPAGGGTVTCSGVSVPVNSTVPLSIHVRAMQVGPAVNTVAITDIGANLIDPISANNQARATTDITPPPVAPAPPFTLTGPVVAGAKVCVPLYMDQNLETQYWWARAAGGDLKLNFATVGINAAEAGSATVKVFNPSGTQIATHTVDYAGTSTVPAESVIVDAATAGQLYRIEVRVSAPPSGPVAHHYLLSATGASLIGTNSPLQPQGEHDDARWRVNVDGAGLSVVVSPAPEAPLTTGSMVIINPSGVTVATVPLTPAGGSYSAPGATTGQWKVAIRGADGHYLLNKLTGADRGLYLGWDAAGSGAVLGTVTRNGLPNTLPVDVQIGGLTLPGILGSFSLPKFPVGTYPVQLIGTSVTGSVTVTCDGTANIALDIPLIPTTTTVNFGPGPFVYNGTPFTATSTVTSGAAGTATIVYTGDCTNAGSTCTATATFEATPVYAASSGSAVITINKAPSITTVSGGGSFTYDGTGHPLTAVVTGVGGLNQPLPVVGCIASPTLPAHNCTGTATYAGDANYVGSTGSATVTITINFANPAGASS